MPSWTSKNFYLSGSDVDIASAMSREFIDPHLRSLMFRAIYLLLSNQFVASKTLQSVFQCISGSGIGLEHSSAIANYLFYLRVERNLVPNSGLLAWIRYHDDILCFSDDQSQLRAFLQNVKCAAEPVFVVKCESMHSVCAQSSNFSFLDLDIVLVVPVVSIESSQHRPVIPLCAESAHSPAVHRSWPGAVCKRTTAIVV